MINREKEFAEASDLIGSVKVFENEQMRVWHITVPPGGRLAAHRHDRPYFWTVTTDGKSRSRYSDGRDVEAEYKKGDTEFFDLTPETGFIHDLENTGDSELRFVTVEFNLEETVLDFRSDTIGQTVHSTFHSQCTVDAPNAPR